MRRRLTTALGLTLSLLLTAAQVGAAAGPRGGEEGVAPAAGGASAQPAEAPEAGHDAARRGRSDAPVHGPQGHGGHRFEDAERWAARFESPDRDAWQKPAVVLRHLGLAPGQVVADIGSATGYFPVRLAPAVPGGRVWAVDVEPDMVRYLNARARREGLANLFSVLGAPDDPLLPERADRILSVDTYHHIADRPAYFRRLRERYLAPEGRLVLVDWKPGRLPMGPGPAAKIPPEQMQRELAEAGFVRVAHDTTSLPYQFVSVFAPAGPGAAGPAGP